MGRFFEGSAEGKGRGFVGDGDGGEVRRLHADKVRWGFLIIMEARDRGGRGFIGLVEGSIGQHCLSMAGAGSFFAKAGVLGSVLVGEMSSLAFLKDGELVRRIWV